MNVVEIRNLTKMYGKARGITNVSFDVKEGEIFGFIGPNGAGKSTTIRTILSLIYPTSGSIKIFGKDAITESHELAKQIGYLPSEVFYYDNMRAIDLLKYSASFYKKDCTKRIHEMADRLHLDLNKKIDDLSYGNKKKVGIIQGLLHSPKLIILDEPTGGLDPLMQQTFFELLREENEKGATILFSSHILSEVQRMCDRVAIIKEGQIVQVEKISILQENTYKKVKIETVAQVDKGHFAIDGVQKLEQKDNSIHFIYQGNVNTLLSVIGQVDVANVWIEEPDLEEIFMHFYEIDDKPLPKEG